MNKSLADEVAPNPLGSASSAIIRALSWRLTFIQFYTALLIALLTFHSYLSLDITCIVSHVMVISIMLMNQLLFDSKSLLSTGQLQAAFDHVGAELLP